MNINIEQLVNEYKENKINLKEYDSYINHVREFKGYIFKEISDTKKLNNESKWITKLMQLNYYSPKLVGIYDNIIITKKINGNSIKDEDARKHLYNIGKLIATLHNLPIKSSKNWKETLFSEFKELKTMAENNIQGEIYKPTINFIEKSIKNIKPTKNVIIHRDIRPGNILYEKDKYYLLDFEIMCVGDKDYDFIRMFNIFNQKEIYNYEDFKNFMDGYKSISIANLTLEKWNFYNKYYAFRMYIMMLCGK